MPDVSGSINTGYQVGRNIGQIFGSQSNKMASQLLLKQLGADINYGRQVKFEALKGGFGVKKNGLGGFEFDPNLSEEERAVALQGYQKKQQESIDRMTAVGQRVLDVDKQLEKLQDGDISLDDKLKVAELRTKNWNQQEFQGVTNPLRTIPIDFKQMFLNGETFKDGLAEGFGTLMIGAAKNDINSLINLKTLAMKYPEQAKNFGIDPKAGIADIRKQFMTQEELDEQALRKKEGELKLERKYEKETWSGPQKGLDEEGKPIVYRVSNRGVVDVLEGVRPEPKKGMKIYDSQGNLIADIGGTDSGMNPPTKTQIEKDLMGLYSQLQDLATLKDVFRRDYLTYGGRFKRFALNEISKMGVKLGKNSKEFVSGARRFIEGIEQAFNKYRKEITGAQAAIEELKMLRDSILNKELSPDEFDASYSKFVDQIERTIKLKQTLLKKGFSDKEITDIINDQYMKPNNIIETRVTKDGRKLVKYSDGSIEEAK